MQDYHQDPTNVNTVFLLGHVWYGQARKHLANDNAFTVLQVSSEAPYKKSHFGG